MSSDFSSASERADLFRAAMIRFSKLGDYATALSGRFSECLEAVQALPRHELTKAIVTEQTMLNDKRIVVMTKQTAALKELITCAKGAPDFAVGSIDISELEQAHSETIEGFKQLLPGLKNLEAEFSKL